MRLGVVVVLVGLMALASSVGSYPQSNKQVVLDSGPGGFTVTLPSEVQTAPQGSDVKPRPGMTAEISYVCDSPPGHVCMVRVGDFEGPALDAPVLFDSLRHSVLEGLHGKLVSTASSPSGKNPGQSFRFTYMSRSGAVSGEGKIVYAWPRIFTLLYISVKSSDLQKPDTRKFFDSFQVKGK